MNCSDVYIDYRKAGYSREFKEAHEADILIHQAAKKYFDVLGVKKMPFVKSLREKYASILAQKKKAYAEYKQTHEEMKEFYNVKSNVTNKRFCRAGQPAALPVGQFSRLSNFSITWCEWSERLTNQ